MCELIAVGRQSSSGTVQRVNGIADLPTELFFEVLQSAGWRDFLRLRLTNSGTKRRVDSLVANRYGEMDPSKLLRFWVEDIKHVKVLDLPAIILMARSLGAQAFSPIFWRIVATVHLDAPLAEGSNVEILVGLGKKFGVGAELHYIEDIVDIVKSAGISHTEFLDSYLSQLGLSATKEADLRKSLDMLLSDSEEDGETFFDAPSPGAIVRAPSSDQFVPFSDYLLSWIKSEIEQTTTNRNSKVLAKRFNKVLSLLDEQARPGVTFQLLSPEMQHSILAINDLLVIPHLAVAYDPIREAMSEARSTQGALGLLEGLLRTARDADTRRRASTEQKPSVKKLSAAEERTRDSWTRKKLELEKGLPEKEREQKRHKESSNAGESQQTDGRTGDEAVLVYKTLQYLRIPKSPSKMFGRIDRDKLRLSNDQGLAFQAAIGYGILSSGENRGVSGIKQRAEYYIVKLSDSDSKTVDWDSRFRLRSSVAIVDVDTDKNGIRYFIFDRTTKSHAGGHI